MNLGHCCRPRHGAMQTWMERVVGRIEKGCSTSMGGRWTGSLRRRWVSELIWAVSLAGKVALFIVVHKTFLPPGGTAAW